MRRLILSFVAVAASYALSASSTVAGGTPKPKPVAKAGLCRPGEWEVTLCHPKGFTFALCAVDGPSEKYVVYREKRGTGPVKQYPEHPEGQAVQFHYSTEGASGWEERVRFSMDGADYYVISAMSKGGPIFERHGWPVNASALIIKARGRLQQHNCSREDDGWISQPNLDLFPREEFDESLRPLP